MNENIPISVVMSVYNGERYLALAIESILKQTFTDFEFIIVDDGSTDRSLKIIRKYEKKDSRIRVLIQENQGLAAALNNGAALARGKYIARMDDDDISLPQRLALQYEFMESHPEVSASGGSVILINKWGDEYNQWTPEIDPSKIDDNHIKSGATSLFHPSTIIRKTSLAEVNWYSTDLRYAQDLDLWLKLGERGILTNLPDALIKYRFHNNIATCRHQQEQNDCALLAVTRARQRRGITDASPISVSKVVVPDIKTILQDTVKYQLGLRHYYKAFTYSVLLFVKAPASFTSDWLAKRLAPNSPWLLHTLETIDWQRQQIKILQEQLEKSKNE